MFVALGVKPVLSSGSVPAEEYLNDRGHRYLGSGSGNGAVLLERVTGLRASAGGFSTPETGKFKCGSGSKRDDTLGWRGRYYLHGRNRYLSSDSRSVCADAMEMAWPDSFVPDVRQHRATA
jgi:hypothetical protein